MNIKNYKYLLILILALFIGCNKTYAVNQEECFYMGDNNFRATAIIRSDVALPTYASLDDFSSVTIETYGQQVTSNAEPINNWYSWGWYTNGVFAPGWQLITRDKKNVTNETKFEAIYPTKTKANNSEPFCPNYLVVQKCNNTFKVWATEDVSIASTAVSQINSQTECQGFYGTYKNSTGTKITEDVYYSGLTGYDVTGNEVQNCEDMKEIFGDSNDPDSVAYLINSILIYVKIIVPILIILLGTLDMFKATIAGKEDEMKKAQTAFIKRIIAGIVVFLVPVIVNIIMNLADMVWEETVWKDSEYSSCNVME